MLDGGSASVAEIAAISTLAMGVMTAGLHSQKQVLRTSGVQTSALTITPTLLCLLTKLPSLGAGQCTQCANKAYLHIWDHTQVL